MLDTEGRLAIAKFPSPTADDWDVIRWEAVALALAGDAGIAVAEHDLHVIENRPVLVVRRFDRDGETRVGYASAMTMLQAKDGGDASYLEIAQAIEERSPDAVTDLRELWRRIVFTILISNTDDHLRNHGFLQALSIVLQSFYSFTVPLIVVHPPIGEGGIRVSPRTSGIASPISSRKHHDHSSPGSIERMIGCPLACACAVA